jgi:hypothetical protein
MLTVNPDYVTTRDSQEAGVAVKFHRSEDGIQNYRALHPNRLWCR